MTLSGYDAWLERPYTNAANRDIQWEKAEEEAIRRNDLMKEEFGDKWLNYYNPWDAEMIIDEWDEEYEIMLEEGDPTYL